MSLPGSRSTILLLARSAAPPRAAKDGPRHLDYTIVCRFLWSFIGTVMMVKLP